MASRFGGAPELPPAVLIMGPTAAGKTAAAFSLFDQLPVDLISVDSAQVYRGLDIGSAKPDAQTLRRYPHELIDVRDPESTYSAALFVADAENAMQRASAAGRMPVLVGGTVLYFRALLFGLDRLPPADPAVRSGIAERAARRGWAALHDELAGRDPATAARLHPSDAQRIGRALEVLELTGRGLSDHHRGSRQARFPSLRVVMTPADRSVLHGRIARRVDAMLAAGLVGEVERLRERPALGRDHAAMKSVGYRQAWEAIERGENTQVLRERIVAATRQLAKRQLTGLRKFPGTLWYDSARANAAGSVVRRVAGFCRQNGGRGSSG
ncbi:MAG: tRNA (adenosine(37)-N6)-dimethylallyltransferase MiaA [Wenzhouxiangella sp.]|nr:MAG: tRNA (adenosine(37)-N6)-dimethylallyltransferase MiaA [Wenzhouxiangella sp.]